MFCCSWLASGFLGLSTVSDLITLLILLLPLAAVFGLAHALHSPSAGLRAVEASSSVTFAQTSIGLGLVLLAFDSVLGLVATLGFTLANWAPFWNLLLAWLAPLLLLTAISLPIALLRSVRLAALVGGVPWLLLGLLALAEQNGSSVARLFFSLPQDTLSFVLSPGSDCTQSPAARRAHHLRPEMAALLRSGRNMKGS